MTVTPTWQLAIVLTILVTIAVMTALLTRTGLWKDNLWAAVRAVVQLALVALVITTVVRNLWLSLLLVCFMYAMAVLTTSRRVGAPGAWPWAALAMAAGAVPVIGLIIASGVVPLNGFGIIPVAGIVIGNTMTAHTLLGRRAFAALREDHDEYEGYLALGLRPEIGIGQVTHRRMKEALIPNIDQTRTVGVVTLPGAFIGVLLGGGTAVQASAAQVLVLFAIMAAQGITTAVAHQLMTHRKLLPADLKAAL